MSPATPQNQPPMTGRSIASYLSTIRQPTNHNTENLVDEFHRRSAGVAQFD